MKIVLLIACTIYFGLSALCLLAPSLLAPETIAGHTLLGPPALFFHGLEIWPMFLGVTAVLLLLLAAAVRYPEGSPIPIGFAAGVWFLSGFFSAAAFM